MNLKWLVIPLSLTTATIALAHEDVENSTVKARMMAMTTLVKNMRTLGGMAKGAILFDQEQAKAALADMESTAKTVPGLFKSDEMHPKSEALPVIWTNFSDFTAKSKALEDAAAQALASFSSKDDLVPSMRALGGTCKSCHFTYRK